MSKNNNFIYSEGGKFIFAYVPKVACTNWKSVLRHMAGFHKDWLDNGLAHDRVRGGLHYLNLDGPEADLLEDPKIRKFTFVRNPYSRILSAYLNKIEPRIECVNSDDQNHFTVITRAIDDYRKNNLEIDQYPVVDFEVFLLWLLNERKVRDGSGHFRDDEHWRPQTTLLCMNKVKYDFIGRFEAIGADAKRLIDEMGAEVSFPSQRDVRFNPTAASNRLHDYYNLDRAELVQRIYADDFRNLSYSVELPV